MLEDKLIYLGNCIRAARHNCGLTQQELADQAGLGVKTLQNIEKGRMNPSYEILYPLIRRLGISADTLFDLKDVERDKDLQHFIGKFQTCSPENKKILLNTLDFLAEQLLSRQDVSKISE